MVAGFEGKIRLALMLNLRLLVDISVETSALIDSFCMIICYQQNLEKFGDVYNMFDFYSFKVDPLAK